MTPKQFNALTAEQAAERQNVDVSYIKKLCIQGRIVGDDGTPATKHGWMWAIPDPFIILPSKIKPRKTKTPNV